MTNENWIILTHLLCSSTGHPGGQVFVVALGIDMGGLKQVLGFWQGATENHPICLELFADLERRGIALRSCPKTWVLSIFRFF